MRLNVKSTKRDAERYWGIEMAHQKQGILKINPMIDRTTASSGNNKYATTATAAPTLNTRVSHRNTSKNGIRTKFLGNVASSGN